MTRKRPKLKPGQPVNLQIQLSHHKQRFNWDCGVSCVLMVLPPPKRRLLLENLSAVCGEEGFNRSTWTIDLCYLLKRFGVRHEFRTVTWGVHPGYRANSFYKRAVNRDETRVLDRFRMAAGEGVSVSVGTIGIEALLEHLTKGPAICLTNARLLCCDVCKLNKVSLQLRKCIPWPAVYQGHYIVLCGYDFESGRVFYRNPSLSDRVCAMPIEVLEEARKDYGTDEDVILIYNCDPVL